MTAQHSTAAEEGEAGWQPGTHNGQKFYNKRFIGTPCTMCSPQPIMNIFRSLVTAMHLYTKAGFREVSLYLFDTVLITSGSVFCLFGLTWPSS